MIVTHLNTRGEGVADGHAVARVLPGEDVTADGKVQTPSPDRVAPVCRHFKTCGGCAMQHASDAFVADWKTDVIRQGLAARGIETNIRAIITSPAQSRRRATLHGCRTKKGAMVGFHMRGSDTLVETPDCQLLTPDLMAAIPLLERITTDYGTRKGAMDFAVTASQNGLDLVVHGGRDLSAQDQMALAASTDLARLTWGDEVIAMANPPVQVFGRAKVTPPPGAFLQATAHGQAALTDAVRGIVGRSSQVIDLFSGCGTFTLPMAETAEVQAFEGDAAMIDALDAGWRNAAGLKRVTATTRDLFRRPLLADEMRKTGTIIIDPPRAGAEAQVIEIAKSTVPTIAAISCNPVSFARDAAILAAGGYTLDWVQPVDQFRWSSHVELAAKFTR